MKLLKLKRNIVATSGISVGFVCKNAPSLDISYHLRFLRM